MTYPIFILLSILATWRITSLLANETGPFSIFDTFRQKTGITCFWCISIWIALPFALFAQYVNVVILQWLAFSAGAILFEEIINGVKRW